MKELVTVSIDDCDQSTGDVAFRISSKTFCGKLTMSGTLKLKIDTNAQEKLKERAMTFFEALNEAFFEFADRNSNQDKRFFDFYY